jgi:hypothetical protein
VDTREAQYNASRSCIFDTADGDALIEEAENDFPGGRAALLESRARPPYLIIAMGTDVQSRDWLNDADGAVNWFYENKYSYQWVDYIQALKPCETEFCADVSPKRPNLGVMMLNIKNQNLVDLNLFEEKAEVDSFCGLTDRVPTREDACGPINGPYLQGCLQPGGGTKLLGRWDYDKRHTCIHDHSCHLTLMSSWDGIRVKTLVNHKHYWKPVTAPGWDLIRHPNASKAWPELFWEKKLINGQWWYYTQSILSTPNSDADTVIPPNTLPINQLWRHHSDSRYMSKFYLPIGVFLEAFNARQGSPYRLDDPSYDPGKPSRTLGMWPMCPHDDATFNTNHDDELKSNFLPSSSVVDYGSEAKRYQDPSVVYSTKQCQASDSGIKTCDVQGFRSYRIGLKAGYTMDVDSCSNHQFPMMVQRDIYKCIGCSTWVPNYCEGLHECLYSIPQKNWDATTAFINNQDKDLFKNGDKEFFYRRATSYNEMRKGYSNSLAVKAALYALSDSILQQNGGDPLVYGEVPSMPLYDQENSLWDKEHLSSFTFNAAQNLQYESNLPPLVLGTRCSQTTNRTIDYRQCDFDDNYDAFIQSVNTNMKIDEGLIIRPRYVFSPPVPFDCTFMHIIDVHAS